MKESLQSLGLNEEDTSAERPISSVITVNLKEIYYYFNSCQST